MRCLYAIKKSVVLLKNVGWNITVSSRNDKIVFPISNNVIQISYANTNKTCFIFFGRFFSN